MFTTMFLAIFSILAVGVLGFLVFRLLRPGNMNRIRLMLYISVVSYHAGAIIFTYMVDGHVDLLGLLKYIPSFKYIAFLGLMMISLDVIWYFIDWRAHEQENKALKDENTNLKARVYDLEQGKKP